MSLLGNVILDFNKDQIDKNTDLKSSIFFQSWFSCNNKIKNYVDINEIQSQQKAAPRDQNHSIKEIIRNL